MFTKGILYICIATLAFAFMNLIAKYLGDFHPLQVVFFRSIGTFVIIVPIMFQQGASFKGKNPSLLTLRAVVGLISLATFFWAIQRIPLGSAISIRYIGPLIGSVLAVYFLKEKIKKLQWLSMAIAFSGVLILKGFDFRIDPTSFLIVLTSAFFLGGVYVLIRYLGKTEHYLTIIFYFMTISIFGSLLFFPYWRFPINEEWWAVLTIGIFGAVGQIFMTKAFQLEETSLIVPFKYMELVYALILGFFIFGEGYDLFSLLGMGLIIVGMVCNVFWKKG